MKLLTCVKISILRLLRFRLAMTVRETGVIARALGRSNPCSNEKGAILITMLLLMVIVTLIGVIAINTATVDIQITGNLKRVSTAFEGAEAGVDLSIPIIENTIAASALTTSSATISTTIGSLTTIDNGATNLENEMLNDQPGGATGELTVFNSDISIADIGQGVGVNVDIDRMYSYALPGGSLEFAAGYEGIGAGAGGGGIAVLYKINSRGIK